MAGKVMYKICYKIQDFYSIESDNRKPQTQKNNRNLKYLFFLLIY